MVPCEGDSMTTAAVTVPELDGGRCRHERSHDGACLDCAATFDDLFLALLDGVSDPEPDPDVYDENLAADPEVGA